jgi:glycosyltransferase involved in cell wall biosynthesis
LTFPLVSYLIPAYNHERFVQQCLDSVLADPYDNKELIVIDDGSSDSTASIIEEWIVSHGDSMTVQFRSRPNRGVTATLNELAGLARGEFLRLGASDDYFLPGGSRLLADYLVAYPDKLAVIGDGMVVNEASEVVYRSSMTDLHHADKRHYATDHGIITSVISRWALAGPVLMIRKGAIPVLGVWDERLRIDDWYLFLRLVARNGLGFIDAAVCAYRLHDTNTCRVTDPLKRIRNLSETREMAAQHVPFFSSPYDALLKAQCRLIDAKVAYLQRRPLATGRHLAAYALLRLQVGLMEGETSFRGACE